MKREYASTSGCIGGPIPPVPAEPDGDGWEMCGCVVMPIEREWESGTTRTGYDDHIVWFWTRKAST